MTMATQDFAGTEVETGEAVVGKSPGQLAWRRFKRDKLAIVSLVIVSLVVLLALAAPLITRLFGVDPFSTNMDKVSSAGGLPLGRLGGMSWAHPLGVEPLTGRDLMARLLYGARVSLIVAVSATTLTMLLGVTIGLIAGYARGWLDTLLARFMDIVLSFPLLLVVLAMSPVLTQRLSTVLPEGNPSRVGALILMLSSFGWPYLARIVRGQVISLREREFVESAVSTGASTTRILRRELFPNLWAPLLVYVTLALPSYIAAEAVLSYLGVGVLPPTATWGAMLADSVAFFYVVPTYLFVPGSALFITVVAFNILGDALNDALDPRSQRA
jgi:ABC-type dipeptide/oligopeptide/nickel transport system permease subunit